MRFLIVSSLMLCCFTSVIAQVFPSGSRVCFVGNSITNNGEFHHNILLYHLTRYPNENVSFFNCGISGDVTGGILNRMDDDVLVHQPTHIVLMIGMNDVKRSLYGEYVTTNTDTLAQRQNAITAYKTNLEKIINIFLSKKLVVILQKPTIYEQTAKLPTKNNLGVNDALKVCADFVGELANKYQLQVVDYWTIMNNLNKRLQEKDSAATLTSNDRVHPQSTGHFVMAYQFLKTMLSPQFVSKIWLSYKMKTDSANNCRITNVKKKKRSISFSVLENALPFPVSPQYKEALDLVSFQTQLNQQLLKIDDLSEGRYTLFIDDSSIANFTAKELKEGIDLSLFKNTPQYLQAVTVRSVLIELWKIESYLRNIKFIEYHSDFKKCNDKTSIDAIKQCLEPVFKSKNTDFYLTQLNKYIANKPQENKYFQTSDELRKKAFLLAQPKIHSFKLVKNL
jgi:lysophospholipase L1-like esterase